MTPKVVKYQTVTDRLAHHLDGKVNKLLEEGWELYGHQTVVAIGSHQISLQYSQVMIKREEPSIIESMLGALPME